MNSFLNDKKFIILNDKKEPKHSLDVFYKIDKVKDEENLGILIEDNHIVIDVDDYNHALKMKHYVELMFYECHIMKTARGYHFWFLNDKPLPNWVHKQNAISIICDIRSFGKKSFVVVKNKNEWREWIKIADILSYIPKELIPSDDKLLNSLPSLVNLKEGAGRRAALFDRTHVLAKEFNKDELLDLYKKLNTFIFDTPLSEKEIENIFANNTSFTQILTDLFFEKNKFKFNEFGEYIHKQLKGLYRFNAYWIYRDKQYVKDKHYIFQYMQGVINSLRQTQRNEVYAYLELKTDQENVKFDNMILNCQNGLLDLRIKKLEKHSPKYFDINLINTSFNENAADENVFKFLNDITNGDNELLALIEEMLGSCLVKDARFQKAFILLGEGANGKSTLLEAIKNMFGDSNCSSLEFDAIMGNRFALSDLTNKMLNVSSELPNKNINETHTFKKLVSGEELRAEFKFENGFYFQNYAKFIFAANTLPSTKDRSYGFFRRFIIIPFNNIFEGEKVDLEMKDKLTTESAKSTFLNLAVKGLWRLLKNKQFSHSSAAEAAMNDYITKNNTVKMFLDEIGDVLDWTLKGLYSSYKTWVNDICLNAEPIEFFKNEVLKKYPEYEIRTVKVNSDFVTSFKRKEIKKLHE